MNYLVTHPTYGEIPYITEIGKYEYQCNVIATAIGCPDGKFSSPISKKLNENGYARFVKSLQRIFIDLQGVEYVSRHIMMKDGRRENARLIYEWLKGWEESARNGAPCTPEPIETEQPTEQGDFLPDFHSYITRLTGKRDECQRTINICESVFMQAAAWKKGWDDISAKYAEQKAQNATLQAQVDELKQQLADNDITDIVNNITKLRYMLGDYELQRYADNYYHDHRDALKYQDVYTPTQMADFVKNMSKFSMHLSAQVVNRKLEEAGYQEHCDSNEEGAYKLTSWIDESYAYKTFIKGNNDFVLPSLVWTKKGLALFIGLLLDTELIEGTCI